MTILFVGGITIICPVCRNNELVKVMTRQGVEIDECPCCHGIWLDRDEIFHFANSPTQLKKDMDEAMFDQKLSDKVSPASGVPMITLPLKKGTLNIEYCSSSEGIWLDNSELNSIKKLYGSIDVEKMQPVKNNFISEKLHRLPNLALISTTTLFSLYALLMLLVMVVFELLDVSLEYLLLTGILVAVFQFALGPFFMDISLRFLYRARWIEPEELPAHLRLFIERVCQEKKIKFPKMGIISDGAPNAFTYGHTPNNARIVITDGLTTLLNEDELEAVVAHEIGHAVHWDMLVMTIAQLVPLISYYIYKTLIKMKSRGKRDKSAGLRVIIALSAYIIYIISEYIVLWFSRVREYYADRFAGEVTNNPNSLAEALVKIGYGLAGTRREEQESTKANSIQALGIFDTRTAKALAISGYSEDQLINGSIDKEKIKDVAKWDLWNPWAIYYELHSTHPLIAKRLNHLSNQSEVMGLEPYIKFDETRPESYWDEFLFDVFMLLLPTIAMIAGFITYYIKTDLEVLGMCLVFWGLIYIIHVVYRYPSAEFAQMNVLSLLKKIKVSAVRAVPCRIRGRILGRGIPGYIFSEDFVMKDKYGIMFLDYNQPLAIFNTLFSLFKSDKYIDQDVEITGWYRRAPVPYIEVKTIQSSQKISKCYTYNAKLAFGGLMILLGIIAILKYHF